MSGPRTEPTAEPLIPWTRVPPEADDTAAESDEDEGESSDDAPIGTATRVP